MDNKKISTKIGIIVIIIITIITGLLMWKSEKDKPQQISQQVSSQNNATDNSKERSKVEISDKWTLISHYNFWSNPNIFKRNKYEFPNIEFSYPENWEFRCCGDMDNASEHFINPPNRDKSSPYIRIINFSLLDCPSSKKNCSLEEMFKITSNEKFNRLISSVPSSRISPKKKLAKLDTSAFVYKKMEKDSTFSLGYIINLRDGVIEIDFVNYELFDNIFIDNFLNYISFESK